MKTVKIVRLSIAESDVSDFLHVYKTLNKTDLPAMSVGQAFHRHAKLHVVNCDVDKVWCDRLFFEGNDQKAMDMIYSKLLK